MFAISHLLSRCVVYLPHTFRKNNKNQYSNCSDTNSNRGAALSKLFFLITNPVLVGSTGVLQIIRIKSCFGVLTVKPSVILGFCDRSPS